MLLPILLMAVRQRHAVVVTCRYHKLCKMEYFLCELLKGLWSVFSGWKWLITEIINLVPVILFRQLASDNVSHHSAELTWWQLVSTLHCIQDSLLSQDTTWSEWGWWFPSVLLLHMLGYYQAYCKPYSGFGGLEVSVLAFGTRVHGFKPSRSCRIFWAKKSSARLPSEGK